MTDSRKARDKSRLKRQRIEKAEREGRLRPATSRCGPWIVDPDGREECMACGDVDYPGGMANDAFGI